MNLTWAVVIIVAAVAVAVAAMLLIRRRAPDGSFFKDGDRASGVFGVLATGFSLLLGLIVFLAFNSYDESKTGAESEALAVIEQFEAAHFLPAATHRKLSGELVAWRRRRRRKPPWRQGMSSAPPTTFSAWSCSRPRCSSAASVPGSGTRRRAP